MSITKLSNKFESELKESGMSEAEALNKFAADHALTLNDMVVLIAERPSLGRLHFTEIANITLEYAGGRPIKYVGFYEEMLKVLDAFTASKMPMKFVDAYKVSVISAKSKSIEPIPSIQTAYQHARKTRPELWKTEGAVK